MVSVCAYVCMYVCMYVCTYARVHVSVYACKTGEYSNNLRKPKKHFGSFVFRGALWSNDHFKRLLVVRLPGYGEGPNREV